MTLLADLLDLVLPATCAGCGRTGVAWCQSCAAELTSAARAPLGRTAPTPCPPGFPPAAAAACYEGAVRGALVAHKERGRLGLAAPLAAALAAAVQVLQPRGAFLLVPVPSSARAVRVRGFDHARRLADEATCILGRQGADVRVASLLRPSRSLGDQAGLTATARAANLAGGLTAVRPLLGCSVVVVDDVVTTGATLAEATRALRVAGAQVFGAASVAAAVRRHPVG